MKTLKNLKGIFVILLDAIFVAIFVIGVIDSIFGIPWLPTLEINLVGQCLNVITGSACFVCKVKAM